MKNKFSEDFLKEVNQLKKLKKQSLLLLLFIFIIT